MIVRGNYSHHNYRGGWSQGFNMVASGAGGSVVIEHNVFRGSSWTVQDVAGEFRYNLIYGYGHTWLRSGNDGAAIHHNVFAPEQGGGESDQGIWMYGGESGIQIYNNTFDGGGDAVTENFAIGNFPFTGPVVEMSNNSHVISLRNNLMTYTTNFENGPGNPHVTGDPGTFGTVDYNAFYSPDNTTHDNYDISGMSEGVTQDSPRTMSAAAVRSVSQTDNLHNRRSPARAFFRMPRSSTKQPYGTARKNCRVFSPRFAHATCRLRLARSSTRAIRQTMTRKAAAPTSAPSTRTATISISSANGRCPT